VAKPPSFIANPKVIAGMVLGLVGGIMLIIGPFINFISGCRDLNGYSDCQALGIASAGMPAELLYGYLVLIFGILLLLFSILTPFFRKKQFAAMTMVFGLLGMILSIVILVHAIARADAIGESFGYSGVYVLPGVGFFLAVVGGVLGLVGGIILGKEIARLHSRPMGAPAPMGAPPYGQPPMQQYPPGQYPPQQPPTYGPPPAP